MPAFVRQYPVGGYYLDVFAEAEMIAFELDGATYHGGAGDREPRRRR